MYGEKKKSKTIYVPRWLSCKESTYQAGDVGSIPGQENTLEKEMATHSSILAWEILWIEEPGQPRPMGSKKSQT